MNTIGNLLKEKRESLGLSIEDVEKKTKVQKIYLEAIERDDFSFFENQAFYQQVFVGSYADVVGLDKGEVLVQLNNEMKNYQPGKKESVQSTPEVMEEKVEQVEVPEEVVPVEDVVVEDTISVIDEEPFVAQPVIEETKIGEFMTEETPVVEDSIAFEEQPISDVNISKDINFPVEVEETKVEDVAVEVSEPLKNTQPIPKIFDSFLQDYEVKPEVKDEVVENAILNNEIIDQQHDEISNDEINQLIDEINQNVDEVNLDEYFETSSIQEPVQQVTDINNNETLNSSILDDIQKINEDVQPSDAFATPSILENPSTNFEMDKDQPLESTAVIDITSGIELEKIPSHRSQEPMVEEPVQTNTMPVDGMPVENVQFSDTAVINSAQHPAELTKDNSINQATSNEDIFKTLEQSFPADMQSAQIDDLDPEKTSMDLKVAKALGDSKVALDEEDKKRQKRFSLIDYLLIIVLIVLVVCLAYIAWRYISS